MDLVAAEDTRHTAGLLAHFAIQKKLLAVHAHNEQKSGHLLVDRLLAGASVALLSDAGTPGISDPGAVLVGLARQAGIPVVPIPGACAVITALCAAGISENGFVFAGFLPATASQRRKILAHLKQQSMTLVFYEAPHRIVDSVQDMAEVLGAERQITIARELTKTFETFHRCKLGDAVAWLQADANQRRGEFVLLVEAPTAVAESDVPESAIRTLDLLLAELPLKQAVKLAVEITGLKKNVLYALALERKLDDSESKTLT